MLMQAAAELGDAALIRALTAKRIPVASPIRSRCTPLTNEEEALSADSCLQRIPTRRWRWPRPAPPWAWCRRCRGAEQRPGAGMASAARRCTTLCCGGAPRWDRLLGGLAYLKLTGHPTLRHQGRRQPAAAAIRERSRGHRLLSLVVMRSPTLDQASATLTSWSGRRRSLTRITRISIRITRRTRGTHRQEGLHAERDAAAGVLTPNALRPCAKALQEQ